MSLSSLQLDAFHCVAQTLNLSKAAKILHITQSALTQRIQNLEEHLGMTLFVRHPRGVQTTLAGERLLRYCLARARLEEELLEELQGDHIGLGGVLRVAGYSTIHRSVLLPALAPLLRANRRIQPFLFDAEVRALPDLLLRGEADYIVIDRPVVRTDVETIHLGDEENVLVSSRDHPNAVDEIYLDHDPDDTTTLEFLKRQDLQPTTLKRAYLDEIYSIMDGVAHGLGKAIIPRHLASHDPRLIVEPGIKPVIVPVYLQFFKQPLYTKLHAAVVGELSKRCTSLLQGYAPA